MDIAGVLYAGNDPDYQTSLRSLMDIGRRTQLDLTIRAVGALPSPSVPAYGALDVRVAHSFTDRLELALAGYNLLDRTHVEFINPALPPSNAPRSVLLSLRWRR
jgi:iron complex outermembrane receptor protein